MLLSIIVPVYNEEELVCQLLAKLRDIHPGENISTEVIIVDDGSTDQTATRIETFLTGGGDNMRLIRHACNQGKGAAVRTGLENSKGEILIIQDADLEYDPEDIRHVIAPIIAGEAEVVYGSRILREKELGRSGVCGLITGKHPHSYVLAYLGGVAITKFINLLTRSCLTDEPTCYKSFKRSALAGHSIQRDDFAWEPEITMKLLGAGFEIREVPVSYHPRKRNQGKKINWRDGVKALWIAWCHR